MGFHSHMLLINLTALAFAASDCVLDKSCSKPGVDSVMKVAVRTMRSFNCVLSCQAERVSIVKHPNYDLEQDPKYDPLDFPTVTQKIKNASTPVSRSTKTAARGGVSDWIP
eukprot:6369047-Amphidinium_carterae.1